MRLLGGLLVTAILLCGQTVSGIVVNSLTGTLISAAVVRLSVASRGNGIDGSRPYDFEATSDPSGRFSFDLRPGNYLVWCNVDGYRWRDLTRLRVVAEADPEPLRIALTPNSVISGRVLDQSGRGVSGATVQLIEALSHREVLTESDGAYSFDHLAAGDYAVLAAAPEDLRPSTPVDGVEFGWVPTYYPSAADRSLAEQIHLHAGAGMTGIEIKLAALRVRHVRGWVLDPDNNPVPDARIEVSETAFRASVIQTARASAEGSFDLAIPDGVWRLTASTGEGEPKLQGYIVIRGGRADSDGLELRIQPPFSIRGSITYDPPPPKDAPRSWRPIILSGIAGRDLKVTRLEGDRFAVERIFPAPYEFYGTAELFAMMANNGNLVRYAFSPSPPYYLASITAGGQEVMGKPVDIFSEMQAIEFRFEAHGGTIRGTVKGDGEAEVVLDPQETSLRGIRNRIIQVRDGRFEAGNIAPGSYFVYAVPEGVKNLPADIEAVHAATVVIRPSETATVELIVAR